MKFAAIYPACFLWLVNGNPLSVTRTASNLRRDLLGLLGDVGGTSTIKSVKGVPPAQAPTPTSTPVATLGVILNHDITVSVFPTAPAQTTTKFNTVTLLSVTEKAPEPASPLLTTPASPRSSTVITKVATVTDTATEPSAAYPIGYEEEAPTTPPGELTEWKVIGIAVTTITFFATVVLSVVFFDSWWGFLRAAICGKSSGTGEETLVPDWGRRSWEFKLANEDGHRYPTMASLESIVKEKDKAQSQSQGKEEVQDGLGHMYDIKSPEMAHETGQIRGFRQLRG